jgi:hypothetical protein
MLDGLDEILTGLPKELRRALACTNIVENVMRSVSRLPQGEAMAISFNDIALDRGGEQEAAKGSRRLKAHKQLPALRATLEAHRTKASTHGVLARQADARVTSTSATIAPQCSTKGGTGANSRFEPSMRRQGGARLARLETRYFSL